jgi:hypothetical protein
MDGGCAMNTTTTRSEVFDVFDAVVAALLADPSRPLRGSALDRLLEPITRTSREEAS